MRDLICDVISCCPYEAAIWANYVSMTKSWFETREKSTNGKRRNTCVYFHL